MAGKIVESQLNNTPKFLTIMGFNQASIDYIIKAQKDNALNPNHLYAGDLAISLRERAEKKEITLPEGIDLSKATAINKQTSMYIQTTRIMNAVMADLASIKEGNSFNLDPNVKTPPAMPDAPYNKPDYHPSPVTNPTVGDAALSAANLAANMVKEAARHPELVNVIEPLLPELAKLSQEAQMNPALTDAQKQRFQDVCSKFLRSYPGTQEQCEQLNTYLREAQKQFNEGCAGSVKTKENAQDNGVSLVPKVDPRVAKIDEMVKQAGTVHHTAIARLQATILILGAEVGDIGIDGSMGKNTREGLNNLLTYTNMPAADRALLQDAVRQVDPTILQRQENKQVMADADAVLDIKRNTQQPVKQQGNSR